MTFSQLFEVHGEIPYASKMIKIYMRARCISGPPGSGVSVPAVARNRSKFGTLSTVECKYREPALRMLPRTGVLFKLSMLLETYIKSLFLFRFYSYPTNFVYPCLSKLLLKCYMGVLSLLQKLFIVIRINTERSSFRYICSGNKSNYFTFTFFFLSNLL